VESEEGSPDVGDAGRGGPSEVWRWVDRYKARNHSVEVLDWFQEVVLCAIRCIEYVVELMPDFY
jgi:hypothetical protein